MLDESNVVPPAVTKASKIRREASNPAPASDVLKLAVPSAYSDTRSPVFRPKVSKRMAAPRCWWRCGYAARTLPNKVKGHSPYAEGRSGLPRCPPQSDRGRRPRPIHQPRLRPDLEGGPRYRGRPRPPADPPGTQPPGRR